MWHGDLSGAEEGGCVAVWTRVVEHERHRGIRWIFLHLYPTVPNERLDMPGLRCPKPGNKGCRYVKCPPERGSSLRGLCHGRQRCVSWLP